MINKNKESIGLYRTMRAAGASHEEAEKALKEQGYSTMEDWK